MSHAEHERIYATPGLPAFEFHELDDRLLVGRNPLTAVDVDRLLEAGVTHVLDLREEREWAAPGRHGRAALDAIDRCGISRLHVPIPDTHAALASALDGAVTWIARALTARGSRVFVHCRAGRERTAMVVAAYLCAHEDFTVEQSLAWLRKAYGGHPLEPQIAALREWTRSRPTKRDAELRSRVLGCVLAGAVGDALGAAVEFDSLAQIRRRFGHDGLTRYAPAYGRRGAITDDTQMTLFTIEGLIRANVRARTKGICHIPGVVWWAYRRWLSTQDGRASTGFDADALASGRLVHEQGLHHRRAPGNTCLGALRTGEMGTPEERLNDSKGCGGVMRVAPVGLVPSFSPELAFDLGCDVAAVTHGHPTGWLASGAMAYIVRRVLDGTDLRRACTDVLEVLRDRPHHEETTNAVLAALDLADDGAATPESVETLGAGWTAEEALSIALYAALTATDLRTALLVAVNHSGDSDSTGAIAGNLLGVMHGIEAVPGDLLGGVELRGLITTIANDFVDAMTDREPEPDAATWDRYPGW